MHFHLRLLGISLLVPTAFGIDVVDGIHSLNETLGGRVHYLVPFARSCFSNFEGEFVGSDEALCAEREDNYTNSTYRREVASAYTNEQSAICASDPSSLDQCLLDWSDPTNEGAWMNRSCHLGNLPSWYLEVQDANDVSEVFKYARSTGGKLSIKNSGHSYMGDSAQRGSLMLWTRGLQGISRNASFVPEGCPVNATAPVDSITTGAGASCGEAYEFAHSQGVFILCGFSPTVGISGGWVQGAGHSILSNKFGLGVDRVLQFTVVTPDGELRVANRCQNTDLFWALRGGGGGTYGVVLDSTHAVEPEFPLAVAEVGIPTNASAALGDWMELLVDTAIEMAEDGWGGHGLGYSVRLVTAALTTVDEAEASLSKLTRFAKLHGGQAKISTRPNWYSFFEAYVLSSPSKAGNMEIISTRVTPAAIFADDASRQKLKDYFYERIAEGGVPLFVADAPYLFEPERNATSLNPGWYGSPWLLGERSAWKWNSTLSERIEVAEKMLRITEQQEAVTPGGATYKNEANPFTPAWRETWYGENYDALLAVKHKYDPDGILSCWGCVGWTEDDAQDSCYSAFVGLAQS